MLRMSAFAWLMGGGLLFYVLVLMRMRTSRAPAGPQHPPS